MMSDPHDREPVDQATIDGWRVNYGLDTRTPADAARYWAMLCKGMAPAGAVAALGIALDDLDALRKAQAAHAAIKVRENVGKYTQGLDYQSAYLPVIREFVTVGFDYSPEEPGDAEQPTIGECFEIQEVWLRGVELGEMAVPYVDELEDAVRAARGAE